MTVQQINSAGNLYFKCPYCNFRNIHRDTIEHHIRHKEDEDHRDANHGGLIGFELIAEGKVNDKFDNKEHSGTFRSQYIKCLWCNHKDTTIRNLEYHILENHKIQLYREIRVTRDERKRMYAKDPFSFMYQHIDCLLEKATKIAKQRSGFRNV